MLLNGMMSKDLKKLHIICYNLLPRKLWCMVVSLFLMAHRGINSACVCIVFKSYNRNAYIIIWNAHVIGHMEMRHSLLYYELLLIYMSTLVHTCVKYVYIHRVCSYYLDLLLHT